jgi:pimeloyl-ACP methyl ester carboxylesterase
MSRLLLLPGLGADVRLFAGLGPLGLPIVPRRLPVPQRLETMTAYALRVAAEMELRPEDWIGGASFGALVAADIARRRPVAGLVLIGGALSANAIPKPGRILAALASRQPLQPLWRLIGHPAVLSLAFRSLTPDAIHLLVEMLKSTPNDLLREGARMLASYRPSIPVLCPVFAIHGAHDRLMRPPALPHCLIVEGAGHALALTHAQDTTRFLQEILGTARSSPQRSRELVGPPGLEPGTKRL